MGESQELLWTNAPMELLDLARAMTQSWGTLDVLMQTLA